MRIKYLYISIIFLSIVFFIYIVRNQRDTKVDTRTMKNPHSQMPNDSIHQNLFSKTNPSRENVSQEFRQKLQNLENKYHSNPDDLKTGIELADLYLAAHQNEKAISIYEKFRDKLPKETLFSLTLAYYNLKNFSKAEEITRLILKKYPDEYRAKFNLASIKASIGEKEIAKKLWTEIIENYPETDEAKQAKIFLERLK